MPRVTVRYEFGRINLLPHVEDKLTYLTTGFTSGVSQEFHGSFWSFLDVDQLVFDDDEYISGYLVKFERESAKDVADTKQRRITTEMVRNAVNEKARFVFST
ncbi:MAG TPA: hypothetical protein VLB76_14505 [Thermoanaerobaculia bacterium]|nr:hypothetical protein [Thermoanaerobaculia bacterium]